MDLETKMLIEHYKICDYFSYVSYDHYKEGFCFRLSLEDYITDIAADEDFTNCIVEKIVEVFPKYDISIFSMEDDYTIEKEDLLEYLKENNKYIYFLGSDGFIKTALKEVFKEILYFPLVKDGAMEYIEKQLLHLDGSPKNRISFDTTNAMRFLFGKLSVETIEIRRNVLSAIAIKILPEVLQQEVKDFPDERLHNPQELDYLIRSIKVDFGETGLITLRANLFDSVITGMMFDREINKDNVDEYIIFLTRVLCIVVEKTIYAFINSF